MGKLRDPGIEHRAMYRRQRHGWPAKPLSSLNWRLGARYHIGGS